MEDTMRSLRHSFLLGAMLAGALTACQSPTAPDEQAQFGISTTPRQPRPPLPPVSPDLTLTTR